MKIRDLRRYVEAICGTSSLANLGNNNDALLIAIHANKSKVDTIIKSSASFASNAHEQLFYEFVQNAYDANADTLLFNANEEYLVVLNNGDPFISTKDALKNDIPGELYSFLAKGKSDKDGNEATLGQHGQGSKLLYTLISHAGIGDSREKLLHSIKELKKGPYLISWDNPVQLSNLLLNTNKWEYSDPDDYKNAILICKILYSYYPIAPGIDQSYFSDDEYQKMVMAFDTLVDPKKNLNKMSKGTALIIPLGKNQYKAISNPENIENVKRRLGGFVSITNNLLLNHDKKLKTILVLGEDISYDDGENMVVEFDVADTHYNYQFVFNPTFANEGYVNFFQYLPIVDTKLHLGFIVNSRNFSIDESRQRISEKDKTSEELQIAFKVLRGQVEALKYDDSDRDRFDYIYRCLLETHIPDDEDRRYVKKAFDAVFYDFFMQNILTKDGSYQPFEKVRHIKNGKYEIPFEKVGVEDRYWISEETYEKLLNNHNIEIEDISLYDTILECKYLPLASWILTLNLEEYTSLHNDLSALKRQPKIRDLKVFKSNKGNLFSPLEIEGEELVFYYDRTFKADLLELCQDIEYIVEEYEFILDKDSRKDSEQKSVQAMFSKIQTNQEYFSQTHGRQEFACAILSRIHSISKEYAISSLEILQDRLGNVKPFNQIFLDRPDNTSILDNFLCSYKPSSALRDWFINEKTNGWEWIYENSDELFTINDWQQNYHQYLQDINNLYAQNGSPYQKISLYVDENGNAIDCDYTLLEGFDILTEEEYCVIAKVLSDKNIIPYKLKSYYQDANSAFKVDRANLSLITASGLVVDKSTALIFAKVDSAKAGTIKIKPVGDKYHIQRLGEYEFNFYDENPTDELVKAMEGIKFYSIPSEIASTYSIEALKSISLSNKYTLRMAIKNAKHSNNTFEGLKALLPFVQKVNDPEVALEYITSVKSDILINATLTEEDFAWQFIKFAMENRQGDHIYTKIRFNGNKLPEEVFKREHYFNGHRYDCYELIPEWETANAHLEDFLNNIPDREGFYKLCVVQRENSITDDNLYYKLTAPRPNYSIQQLRYIIDYSCHKQISSDRKYNLVYQTHFPELLKIIFEEGYKGFDKYLNLPGFYYTKQIWTDRKYISADERVPEYLENWLNANPTAVNLFTHLYTEENNPQIKFRKALLGDDVYLFSKHDFTFRGLTNNTFQWILNQHFNVSANSVTYNLVCQLIKECFEVRMILPKYLDIVDMSNPDDPCCMFSFTEAFSGGFFICNEKYGSKVARVLTHNRQVQDYFAKHMVCDFIDERLFLKMHLDENREVKVIDSAIQDNDCNEWNDELYTEWRAKRESENIRIYTTTKHVQRKFVLSTSEKDLLNINLGSREYGYSEGSFVIVTHPNSSGESIMKALEKVSAVADFFKLPFIALQSLYVEQMLNIQKEAEKNNVSISDIIRNISKEKGKQEDLSPELKFIKENLSEAEQQAIIANIDKIRDLLADEEELPSKARALVGFIGELIYERYLRRTKQSYEFSADQGIGEYDFKIKSDDGKGDIYVDIKTNLYSFADGNIPFYLHASQGAFLQKHPDARYHIVRISLKDLNLAANYEEARYMDDKENLDPRQNPAVRAKCERIAANYWEKARISEFRGSSKEYMIRLEKPDNE